MDINDRMRHCVYNTEDIAFYKLFAQGLESGFGDDEAYNVYDKAWRKDQGLSSQLYRPRGERETAEDIDSMIKTRR